MSQVSEPAVFFVYCLDTARCHTVRRFSWDRLLVAAARGLQRVSTVPSSHAWLHTYSSEPLACWAPCLARFFVPLFLLQVHDWVFQIPSLAATATSAVQLERVLPESSSKGCC